MPLTAPRTGAEIALEPGSTLVLYSDGLVERRNELLDVRLDRLLTEIRALDGLAPAELAPALLAAMSDESPASDDVVFLAVRFEGV